MREKSEKSKVTEIKEERVLRQIEGSAMSTIRDIIEGE